jgi:hypothetical protein
MYKKDGSFDLNMYFYYGCFILNMYKKDGTFEHLCTFFGHALSIEGAKSKSKVV